MTTPIVQEGKQIVQANKNTRFQQGNQAAKGHGRPKTKTITEYLRKRCENGAAEELGEQVIQLGLTSKFPSVRLAAINSVADRVDGKPTATLRVEQSLSPDDARRLTLIAESLGILAGKELE